jgi:trimeric autotransporter adhesin
MASTYVNDLRLEEMATGDQSGTWGDTTNVNLELIAEAFSYGTEASFSSDADATTTIADGATDPARSLYLKVTSGASLTATRTLTIAPNTVSKIWIIENATSGSQSINISQGSGANVTIPNGDVKVIYTDGAGAGAAVVDAFTDLNLGGTTTVAALDAGSGAITTTGTVTGGTLAGTLSTAAQTNITSVGTLTGLTVNGDVTLTGSSYNIVFDQSDNALEFADSAKATFGAGSDLQIYHDGSNSYVNESGTGNLYLQGTNHVYLTNSDGSKTYFAGNSPTGWVKLYYDNSVKLETTSTGIDVTGVITTDGLTTSADINFGDNDKAIFGAGSDLQIYHDGSNSYLDEQGTGVLYIRGSAGVYIMKYDNTETLATFLHDDGVYLYHNNNLKIATTSTGIDVTGTAVTDGLTVAGNVSVDSGTIKLDGNYPTGTNNVALGNTALDSITSGDSNVAIGTNALTALTEGTESVAVGALSLATVTTDNFNTGVGYATLNANTTGTSGTAIGRKALTANTTGDNNTAVGALSLDANTEGATNTAVGYQSLSANTTASQNTAVGSSAMAVNTTGANNTALGHAALDANTTASNNTAIGKSSLDANTTGAENTAVGKSSMAVNTTGSYNVALGVNALDANTTANNNTALGFKALTNTTTAGANTAIGSEAAHDNTTGSRLTAVGYKALYANTTGINNTAVGCEYSGLAGPLGANTTGSSNVAMGDGALAANTTADNNTAVGLLALRSNTTGTSNTAIGALSLDANTTAIQNTAVGREALTSSDANNNTGIGYRALYLSTTGTGNTAVGSSSLDSNTTANNNTGVGYLSLAAVTTGHSNTAVGSVALQSSGVDTTDCVAVGCEALRNASGNRNIGIGNEAGRFATGDDNIVIGDLAADTSTFTGSDNIMIGSNAGTRATSSEANVFIGFQSGDQVTTGDDNTFVGYDSGDTVTTGFQNTCIGNRADASATIANATSLGYNISVTSSNNVFIGNTSVSAIKGQVAFSTYSDERIKREIEDSDLGLEFIKELKPRKYKRVAPKDYPEEFLDKNKNDLSNPDEVVDGLIAQEVKQTMDKLGVSFSGWDEDENTTKQSLEYATFVPALIKSIQELSSQVDELKAEIQTLKGE